MSLFPYLSLILLTCRANIWRIWQLVTWLWRHAQLWTCENLWSKFTAGFRVMELKLLELIRFPLRNHWFSPISHEPLLSKWRHTWAIILFEINFRIPYLVYKLLLGPLNSLHPDLNQLIEICYYQSSSYI